MTALRSLVFNVLFYVLMLGILFGAAPFFWLLNQDGMMKIVRFWARSSSWLLKVICKTDYELRGTENLPEGGYILAPKHQSLWETFGLIPLLHNPCYVIKGQLRWLPIWGWYAAKARMIFVDRGRGSVALRQIVEGARRVLPTGRPIMIFPEGTRRPPGAEPAYKFGITFLYRSLGVPVVPVALNAGLYWPRRKFLRHPGTILVEILPPIAPGLSTEAFQERLIGGIEEASDRLLVEAAHSANPPPFPPMARARLEQLEGRG